MLAGKQAHNERVVNVVIKSGAFSDCNAPYRWSLYPHYEFSDYHRQRIVNLLLVVFAKSISWWHF